MAALSNVALTDTFSVWMTRTNQLVLKTNEMENVDNSAFGKANTANYFTYLVNANTVAAYDKANTANLLAYDSYGFANTVNIRVVAAFAQSNISLLVASSAYNKANAANSLAEAAFNQANSGTSAAAAYDKANSANYYASLVDANASAAFIRANNANILAQQAFALATEANTKSAGAYALANTLNVTHQTLTDGGTVNWDVSQGKVATLTVSSAGGLNRTVANPTNLRVESYILHVVQGDSTTRSITWGNAYKWTAQTAPPASGGVGTRDVYSFISDGTFMYGSFIPDVR